MNLNEIEHKIFDINNESQFEQIALNVFQFQFEHCSIYNQYCNLIKKTPNNVKSLLDVPFLPIQFFKTQKVISGSYKEEAVFSSSGTTGSSTSKHNVKSLALYNRSFEKHFSNQYPNWKNSTIIGLLPSYLERKGSSLIHMVDYLIKESNNKNSRFQLDLTDEFIEFLTNDPSPKIMFGVTFALLKMADKNIKPKNTIIIETGGMKGRGKELTRDELHDIIKRKMEPKAIHSEYGMTELMSQAYFQKESFTPPSWMKVFVRPTTDPLLTKTKGKGALNIIDLANIHSCAFIAAEDLGEVFNNGSFLVSGRMDHSQIRGCNLLIT